MTPTFTGVPPNFAFQNVHLEWDYEDFIGDADKTIAKIIEYAPSQFTTARIRLISGNVTSTHIYQSAPTVQQAPIIFVISFDFSTRDLDPIEALFQYQVVNVSWGAAHGLVWIDSENWNDNDESNGHFQDFINLPPAGYSVTASVNDENECPVNGISGTCHWFRSWTPDSGKYLAYLVTSNAKNGYSSHTRWYAGELDVRVLLPSELEPTPTPSASPTPTHTPVPVPTMSCEYPVYEENPIVDGVGDDIEVIDHQCYVLVPHIDFRAVDLQITIPILEWEIGLEDVFLFDRYVIGVQVCVQWLQFPSIEIFSIPLPLDYVLGGVVMWLIISYLRF